MKSPVVSVDFGSVRYILSGDAEEHFEVSFMLTWGPEEYAVGLSNVINWTEKVVGLPKASTYADVEAAAMAQMAANFKLLSGVLDGLVRSPSSRVGESGSKVN